MSKSTKLNEILLGMKTLSKEDFVTLMSMYYECEKNVSYGYPVFKTESNKIFKVSQEKRTVSNKKLDRFLESFKNGTGYIPQVPILVSSDQNGTKRILDGNYRVEAIRRINRELPATEKHLPIYFSIVNEVDDNTGECSSDDLIQTLNETRVRWSIKSVAEYYGNKGNENYRNMQELLNKHKSVYGVDVICSIAMNSFRGSFDIDIRNAYKKGYLELTDEMKDEIDGNLTDLEDIINKIDDHGTFNRDHIKNRHAFISALYFVKMLEGCEFNSKLFEKSFYENDEKLMKGDKLMKNYFKTIISIEERYKKIDDKNKLIENIYEQYLKNDEARKALISKIKPKEKNISIC